MQSVRIRVTMVEQDMGEIIGYGELWWGVDEYGPYVAYSRVQNGDGTLPPITFGDMWRFMHGSDGNNY